MGRCGCGSTTTTTPAATFVTAGAEIVITGTGTEVDPFVVTRKKVGSFVMVVDPMATALTTGDFKFMLVVPEYLDGTNVSSLHAAIVGSDGASDSTIAVRRIRAGVPVDILSTDITIDTGEKTSYTSAAPPVVDVANDDLSTGDFLVVDCDAAGAGAAGLQVIVAYAEP